MKQWDGGPDILYCDRANTYLAKVLFELFSRFFQHCHQFYTLIFNLLFFFISDEFMWTCVWWFSWAVEKAGMRTKPASQD